MGNSIYEYTKPTIGRVMPNVVIEAINTLTEIRRSTPYPENPTETDVIKWKRVTQERFQKEYPLLSDSLKSFVQDLRIYQ